MARCERNVGLAVAFALAQACASSRTPAEDAGIDAGTATNQGGRPASGGRGGGVASEAGGAGDTPVAGGGGSGPAAGGGGGQSDADSGPPQSSALCDGSEAMRLMFSSSGGFVPETYGFSFPYGGYLAIDGHCRFFEQGGGSGTVTGTLNVADAAQLSADLAWSKLDEWGDYTGDQSCPDAGYIILGKDSAGLACSCGCDMTAPAGLSQAQMNAYDWQTKLAMIGAPLTGAISAIALPSSGTTGMQAAMTWPLSRAMTAIPSLIKDHSDQSIGSGPYARFDDAADTAALRKLRAASPMILAIPVSDAGKNYDLYLRDELPGDTAAAIKKLQQTWPASWGP